MKTGNGKPLTLLALVMAVLLLCCGLSACATQDAAPLPDAPASQSTAGEGALAESDADNEPDTAGTKAPPATTQPDAAVQATMPTAKDIPAGNGTKAYTVINNNVPYFTEEDYTTKAFEHYSPLDSLGRCGVAYANICQEIMPTEKRGSIGQVKPSGWQTVKYDFVDGKYLYNRCHLIGYQLAAENANRQNLITGTRYFNTEGMLPFENMVADYVKETANHVLYRVTPLFDGRDLVAAGVLLEALSVEDQGAGICFNVFCYNVQPGVTIDYATGKSSLDKTAAVADQAGTKAAAAEKEYVLNNNTHKFHDPSCSSVEKIKAANRQEYSGSRDELLARGYSPCGNCKP